MVAPVGISGRLSYREHRTVSMSGPTRRINTTTRRILRNMQEINRPILKDECGTARNETRENEGDSTWEEIELEEVAIDGICGVY
jgi:mycofactocin precursor